MTNVAAIETGTLLGAVKQIDAGVLNAGDTSPESGPFGSTGEDRNEVVTIRLMSVRKATTALVVDACY